MAYLGGLLKVVSIVRTLNEEDNIRRFIESHLPFSDKILVADGGSTDSTPFICSQYPSVDFRYYGEKIMHPDGTFRNPEGLHTNFLIELAEGEGADWIVQDDCDHEPSQILIENIRSIMESTEKGSIHALLVYLYKNYWYFPELNNHKNPEHLWAWSPQMHKIRCKESNTTSPEYEYFISHADSEVLPHPPYVRFHYAWRNDKQIREKMGRYGNYFGNMEAHPLKRCGILERLPDWMIESTLSSGDRSLL